MTGMIERFKAYDFDADERWRTYFENLLLPPGREQDARLILKYKAKYYKSNVDDKLNVEEILKQGKFADSTQHQQQSGQKPPPPKTTTTPPPPPPSQQQQQSSSPSTATMPISDVIIIIGNMTLIIATILALQPFDFFLARTAMRRACLVSLLVHGYRLKRRIGAPGMTLPFLQAWFQRAASTAEASALFSTLVTIGNPFCWWPLVSISIGAVFNVVDTLHRNLGSVALYRRFGGLKVHSLALKLKDRAMFVAALCEILALAQLLLSFFSVGLRALTSTMMYAQLLRRQFWSSDARRHHLMAWAFVDQHTGKLVDNVPALQRAVGFGRQWFQAPAQGQHAHAH